VLQAEAGRGEAGELMDGGFERQELLVADVFAEQAGEVAVGAGVGGELEVFALGGDGAGVGTESHPGQGDLAADVFLGHEEVGDGDAALVLDDEVHGGVFGRGPAEAGDFGEGFAGVLAEAGVGEAEQEGDRGRRRA
jgi:hypothetical protein